MTWIQLCCVLTKSARESVKIQVLQCLYIYILKEWILGSGLGKVANEFTVSWWRITEIKHKFIKWCYSYATVGMKFGLLLMVIWESDAVKFWPYMGLTGWCLQLKKNNRCRLILVMYLLIWVQVCHRWSQKKVLKGRQLSYDGAHSLKCLSCNLRSFYMSKTCTNVLNYLVKS